MNKDNSLTEKESLDIIHSMIRKAKGNFHETGSSAILWGSIIGFCGFYNFLEFEFTFPFNIDIWLLALVGFIPQVYISIKEKKNKFVKTDIEEAINAVWIVYGISIFCLIFYWNIAPITAEQILKRENIELLERSTLTGVTQKWHLKIFSQVSLLILLYSIPTLTTGIARKFKPMIFGGILCYIFFLISLFTETKWDLLLNGLAGFFCWLIPGMILRKKYLKSKAENV
jgi:hypothetical protein